MMRRRVCTEQHCIYETHLSFIRVIASLFLLHLLSCCNSHLAYRRLDIYESWRWFKFRRKGGRRGLKQLFIKICKHLFPFLLFASSYLCKSSSTSTNLSPLPSHLLSSSNVGCQRRLIMSNPFLRLFVWALRFRLQTNAQAIRFEYRWDGRQK
jgi:hypothetical protein